MVKFGDRMRGMIQAGWESQYIEYDKLKKLIEHDTLNMAQSEAFYEQLAADIRKVDAFVEQKTASLKQRARAARAANRNDDLRDVIADLSTLRRYVGTNVIAATKIIKKHDKHVEEPLQKRERVAALIRSCPGMNSVPQFQSEITDGFDPPDSPPTVAVEMPGYQPYQGGDDDDDKETEASLRSLPGWLLGGAKQDAAVFYKAYLADWRIDSDDEEDQLILTRGPTPNIPKPTTSDWDTDFSDNTRKWEELEPMEKVAAVAVVVAKLALILGSLYAFICSLSFLADGFRLVGGRQAGQVFSNNELLGNPIAGMLMGVLVTVLVQSSSTSTSIIITMVAADLLTVEQAIPLIMGANVGTSVTSTIVALGHTSDRSEFRRAFAAATVHDMFNFLSVAIFLPIEMAFGYLYHLSSALVDASPGLQKGNKPPDILKKLTKPLTAYVI